MTEELQIRDQLPTPTLYQDRLAKATTPQERAQLGRDFEGYISNAVPNLVTKHSPRIAEEVAYAIKPEIDKIVANREVIAAHDSTAGATSVMINGNMMTHGVTNSPAEIENFAIGADLERNAEYATQLALDAGFGKIAVRG